MTISTTIKTICCDRSSAPQMYEFTYEYTTPDDRLACEKRALTGLLGGDYVRHLYPVGLGKDHLSVWRRIDRCLVAIHHPHGGLQSVRDEDVNPVIEDIRANPQRFLPDPYQLLRHYLATNEDLANPEADQERVQTVKHITESMGIDIDRFRLLREFVLRHGRYFTPQPLPAQYPSKERGMCHQESMRLSLASNLVYAEGFALSYRAKIAMLHGWYVDADGRVVDCTWPGRGIAYYGIPFHPQYVRSKLESFDRNPTSVGTGSLLDDPTDGRAVLEGRASNWKRNE